MSRYIDRAELFNRLSDAKTLAAAMAVIQDMPAAEIKNVPDTNVGDMISRQAAIDEVADRYYKYGRVAKVEELKWALEALPSAERHGWWENHGSFEVCSVCGEEQYGHDSGRYYCQNCGARMDLDEVMEE